MKPPHAKKTAMSGVAWRYHAAFEKVYEMRLTMNTVLSSINASSPLARSWSSCFTAYSSTALQISLAG